MSTTNSNEYTREQWIEQLPPAESVMLGANSRHYVKWDAGEAELKVNRRAQKRADELEKSVDVMSRNLGQDGLYRWSVAFTVLPNREVR